MAISRSQHLIGRVLGSCVLEKLLGHGGTSAVFLAQQTFPERKVAVKVFLPRTAMDIEMQREFYSRFLYEAKAASELDHPNILPVYAYGEQDGIPYIVMPYMEGGTLSEYITKHGPLSLSEAHWYLEQMAAALDYAHAHGCVHCDVKPANILLDSEGRAWLTDFGISRAIYADDNVDQSDTKGPRALMGTPDYISPEQAMGKPLDGRSDIYSLGITLFYLLARRLPFRADSAIALALLHIHEEPPALALLRADVTPELDHVVQRALAKQPDDRYQSAGAFSAAFGDVVATSEASAAISSKHSRMLSSKAAHPAQISAYRSARSSTAFPRVLLISALLLTLLIGAVGFTVKYLNAQRAGDGRATSTVAATSIRTATPVAPAMHNYLTGGDWPESSTYFFDAKENKYHIINRLDQSIALAPMKDHTFGDFRLTVTMVEINSVLKTGSHRFDADYYGVVFRCKEDQSSYYLFGIDTSGTGQYVFIRYDGQWNTLAGGPVSSLLIGAGSENTVTIIAQGNTFTFLVNGKPVGNPIVDTSPLLAPGEVGLYVEVNHSEAVFSDLYILPFNK